MIRIGIVIAMLAMLAGAASAHESSGAGSNLAQMLTSHADVIIGAAGTSHYLTSNANRVTALCYNIGTTNGARIGDSSVGAVQGVPLPPATSTSNPYVALDTTADVYIYSASGTTVGCLEVVRP
jgi:hypothetical protein